MGIYDGQIWQLKNDISWLNNQIINHRNQIKELEDLLDKYNKVSSELNNSINSISVDVDKKVAGIKGNFGIHFKENVSKIINSNEMLGISTSCDEDKSRIKSKILELEVQIDIYQNSVYSKENEVARLQSINVEPIEQGGQDE